MNAPAARFPLFVAVILSVLAPAAASAAGVPVLTRETKLVALEEQLFENRVGYSVAVDGNTAVVGSADASAAYVFQRIGGDWSLRQKLTAPDIIGYEYFGITVAINGDTIAVGAPFGNDFTGSAYVFVRTNGVWVQQQKLTASDPNIWDGFGGSFGLEGDTLAIGAPAASPGPTPGAVYVFLRSAGAWSLEQKLTPAGGAGGDVFGSAVALSGSTLVVGSPYDGHAGPYSGSAYVFQRAGSSFSQSQKLTANDAFERAAFGYSAAVAGNTAVLGSPGNVEGGGPGSAYVFVNEGGVWTQQQKLAASDGIGGNDFGFSVALSEKRLVVGSPTDSHAGYQAGSAYVFTKSGPSWSETQKLVASQAQVIANFGFSVATSGDRVVSGAPFVWEVCCRITGAAYVYEPEVTALSPALVWVGLKNSDDVGIRFDLRAQVLVNGSPVGSGHLDGISGGSSGLTNARLNGIPLTLTSPTVLSQGDRLTLDVSVRNACSGSGKNSGSARLWFNGALVDAGAHRAPASRFDATLGGMTVDYFLRQDFSLSTAAGALPHSIDAATGGRCGPFVSLGTWSLTLP
jgi:hypothetical protein